MKIKGKASITHEGYDIDTDMLVKAIRPVFKKYRSLESIIFTEKEYIYQITANKIGVASSDWEIISDIYHYLLPVLADENVKQYEIKHDKESDWIWFFSFRIHYKSNYVRLDACQNTAKM